MRNFTWLACLMIGCLAAARPVALKSGDPLAGDWKITLVPSGPDANQPGVKQFDETLTFTPDKLSGKTLADHGFKPGDYTEDIRAYGPAKFNGTQSSDKEGHIVWDGVEDGGELKGTMVWTKKDGKVIHYDFTGSRSGQ